jgi:hypothetical protein
MALITARQYGIDEDLINRSSDLQNEFDSRCRKQSYIVNEHAIESKLSKTKTASAVPSFATGLKAINVNIWSVIVLMIKLLSFHRVEHQRKRNYGKRYCSADYESC